MNKILLNKEKKQIKREYLVRFLSVFIGLLVFVALVFSFLIYSYYIQIKVSKADAEGRIYEIKNSEFTKMRKDFRDISISINEKLKKISVGQISSQFFIDKIIEHNNGITINNLSLTFSPATDIATIDISGLATDRDALVEFQQKLRQEDVFASVDIPFSNFTINENIPFSAKIVSVDLKKYFEKK
ncbi:MAG TPA: hypothetical protein PKA60_02455 [Candidatus Paceibacterota bacterium]|nr:hypothetical protein [Candidatus Paceibacterota bacterium]